MDRHFGGSISCLLIVPTSDKVFGYYADEEEYYQQSD